MLTVEVYSCSCLFGRVLLLRHRKTSEDIGNLLGSSILEICFYCFDVVLESKQITKLYSVLPEKRRAGEELDRNMPEPSGNNFTHYQRTSMSSMFHLPNLGLKQQN